MGAVLKQKILLSTLFLLVFLDGIGQEGYDLKVEKPKKFENRSLGFEKTYTKKNSVPRKFIQGTVSHYNYFFNANRKLKSVVDAAKSAFTDDFTQLLPFYNYSLEATAANKDELDSVIYKSTAGIVLHDLRNGWVDNLYLLIGQAYFYKNQLDSAAITFQFINFAFAPREKDGYERIIASNASEGGNAFLISSKEKNNLGSRLLKEPPSRNDALVWMLRTAIERNRLGEAAGMIEALNMDPTFPDRLKPELAQMQAYYFYRQNIYDSAAFYLEKALPSAENVTETARWQYLIAQLYERSNQFEPALNWYLKARRTTVDPILDVYARLNAIRMNRQQQDDDQYIRQNIEDLYKMARREAYAGYRDIIYYTAGIMDKERSHFEGLIGSMNRSLKYNNSNTSLKNKTLQQLGDAYFETGMFVEAKAAYDSIQLPDPYLESVEVIAARKKALAPLVNHLAVIERQDSLQRIARLPEEERTALLARMVKEAERRQGKRRSSSEGSNVNVKEAAAANLFESSSGDWYFYNNNLKSKGFTEFQQKWPNRTNVDNWRRIAAINKQAGLVPAAEAMESTPDSTAQGIVTLESLLEKLPLTPEKLRMSDDSIKAALYGVGQVYQTDLEEYRKAITYYENFLSRYASASAREKEPVFNALYYCYWKLGMHDRANRIRDEIIRLYPGSPTTVRLMNPSQLRGPEQKEKEATRQYEAIYRQFIEGNFDQALAMKKAADSSFGNEYWTPQLLYIESVYHIKQRNDSTAIRALDEINLRFAESPLAPKAQLMKSVLARRNEIEDYLTNLQISRDADEEQTVDTTAAVTQPVEPPVAQTLVEAEPEKMDSLRAAGINVAIKPGEKNLANRDKLDKNITLKTTAPLPDSILQKWKAAEVQEIDAVKTDSVRKELTTVPVKRDTLATQTPAPLRFTRNGYTHEPGKEHLVLLIMDKVDPVYVSEARNAFARYNRENYYTQRIDLQQLALTEEIRLLVFRKFPDAAAAEKYASVTRQKAPREVVPWLPADKYKFLIISEENLKLLENNRDIAAYEDFINSAVQFR